MKHPIRIAVVLMSLAGPAWAQEIVPNDQGAAEVEDRSGRREERRARRRDRMEQAATATAEQRREMRIDWMVDRMARTYELTDEQRVPVRAELTQISEERRARMGTDAARMDELEEQIRDYRMKRRESGAPGERDRLRDDPEYRTLREQLRSIRDQHPFDWDATVQRVEKLLPQDQVEAGRARRNERRERRNERMARRAERGMNGINGPGRTWRQRPVLDQNAAMPTVPAAAEWEQYTRDLIARYEFDAGQVNAARSVLKDVSTRGEQIERKIAEQAAAGGARSETLEAQRSELFHELKQRLDKLVTEKQRLKGAQD